MKQTYHANGKLLITAEYLVLKGALAFALPLNKGQSLSVENGTLGILQWKALTPNGLWFNAKFNNKLDIIETSSIEHAKKLQIILLQVISQNKNAANTIINKKVTTQLEFDPLWGWGSSSTLLCLLSLWLKTDPYSVMDATFGGSGYDLACGLAKTPILYSRENNMVPKITPIHFNPNFLDNLGVVWLNKKQISSKEVKRFLSSENDCRIFKKKASELTKRLIAATNIEDFGSVIHEHEALIAETTGKKPVQEKLFADFNGSIKSLGAWGGDFILFVSPTPNSAFNYFRKKGYNTFFNLKQIMLANNTQY